MPGILKANAVRLLKLDAVAARQNPLAGARAQRLRCAGSPPMPACLHLPVTGEEQAHQPLRDFHDVRRIPGRPDAWISINGEPVSDADGVFAGYHGTARDVTQGVMGARALRTSEERFAAWRCCRPTGTGSRTRSCGSLPDERQRAA